MASEEFTAENHQESEESTVGTQHDEVIVDLGDFEETIRMVCPDCGLSGDVPGEWEGLTIECKDCGERFTVTDKENADVE